MTGVLKAHFYVSRETFEANVFRKNYDLEFLSDLEEINLEASLKFDFYTSEETFWANCFGKLK